MRNILPSLPFHQTFHIHLDLRISSWITDLYFSTEAWCETLKASWLCIKTILDSHFIEIDILLVSCWSISDSLDIPASISVLIEDITSRKYVGIEGSRYICWIIANTGIIIIECIPTICIIQPIEEPVSITNIFKSFYSFSSYFYGLKTLSCDVRKTYRLDIYFIHSSNSCDYDKHHDHSLKNRCGCFCCFHFTNTKNTIKSGPNY